MNAANIARYVLVTLAEVSEETESEIRSAFPTASPLDFEAVIDDMVGSGILEPTIIRRHGRFLPGLRLATSVEPAAETNLRIAC